MSSGVIDRNPFTSSAQVENVLEDLPRKQLRQRSGGQERGRESFVGLGSRDNYFLNQLCF